MPDKELILQYAPLSLKHQIRRDRIQLIIAAFSIFIGFVETWSVFHGIALIVPVTGLILTILNLLLARFYMIILEKYGNNVDHVLMYLNGLAMLVTGIAFQYQGSNAVQYVLYFLAVVYIVLPHTLMSSSFKRMKIVMNKNGILYKSIFQKGRMICWSDLISVELSVESLNLKIQNRKKEKKLYIHQNENVILQSADTWIQNVQKKYQYQFNYVSHL